MVRGCLLSRMATSRTERSFSPKYALNCSRNVLIKGAPYSLYNKINSDCMALLFTFLYMSKGRKICPVITWNA